jgi:tetratricopeptide (TPR) repeat protein
MSPEQALAAPDEIDYRTDIYSLGVVLFEMLTGRPAFDGPNPLAVLRRLIDEGPPDLGRLRPELPDEVVAICNRAMARQPADRYASAAAFAEAMRGYLLEGLLVGRPVDLLAPLPLPAPAPARARSLRRLAVGVLGTVLLAAGVAIALGNRPRAPVPEPAPESADPGHLSRSAIIARSKEQLSTLPGVADGQTVRDRLQSVLEDLTLLLRQHPDDAEGRLLRARASRQGGECLAAIAELNAVCGRDPANLNAVAERLLASYQLHVLYLGNINDPALRPNARGEVRTDVERLKREGDQRLQDLAGTVEALARFDYVGAGEQAKRLHSGTAPPGWHADLAMVEADAFFHAVEFAYGKETTTEGQEQERQRRGRTVLLRQAVQALRRGLDGHPTHLGLLFLKANAVQRSAVWEGDGEARDVLLRRQRPAFESALDRLRRGALRLGCDSMIARAVLLDNFDRRDPAIDQLTDALATRSPLGHLPVWKAWLRLQQPSDGALRVEEIDAIMGDLAPTLGALAEDYRPYYVRALLQAHAGRWQEAQRDLRRCRRLGADHLPEIGRPHEYQWWYALAEAGSLRFLHGTIDVIGASPVDVRIGLIEELLRRLADGELVKTEAVGADEVKGIKAQAHFRRARCAAEKEDRAGVLAHLRQALAQRHIDLTPKQAREDEQLKAWSTDPEFQKLYAEFEPKNGGR